MTGAQPMSLWRSEECEGVSTTKYRVTMPLTVAELSETCLLKRIFPRLAAAQAAVVGPGDDAAVLAVPDGRVVISIDTLVEDKDFRLLRTNGHLTTGYDVGWKAAAQNLSDINAMGGRATSLVVSLTLPGGTPVKWVEDFADGMSAAVVELGADGCGVVGGDLGGGREIVATTAVTGSLEAREPVLRSGAQPGDVLALAGTVGWAAAGLALMESRHSAQLLEPDLLALVEIQRRPRPPLQAGPAATIGGATSMLDVSDGLLRDAGRLAEASSVTVDFDPVAINKMADPLQRAADLLGVDSVDWVLGGGEDYSLLASFPPDTLLPDSFRVVGTVSTEATTAIGSVSRSIPGWDHFRV